MQKILIILLMAASLRIFAVDVINSYNQNGVSDFFNGEYHEALEEFNAVLQVGAIKEIEHLWNSTRSIMGF